MITHVAILHDGKVWRLCKPNRHHHVIQHIAAVTGARDIDGEQGFLTDTEKFVSREEALIIAHQNGQIVRKTEPKHLLFSEDIW